MSSAIKLQAPNGHSGQINAAKSGNVYQIASDGTVSVDLRDLTDLLNAGYSVAVAPQPAVIADAPVIAAAVTTSSGADAAAPNVSDLIAEAEKLAADATAFDVAAKKIAKLPQIPSA